MPAGASEDFLFCAVEIDSLLLLLLLLLYEAETVEQLRQIIRCLAMQVLVGRHPKLVCDSICHVEPTLLRVKQVCQAAVVLLRAAHNSRCSVHDPLQLVGDRLWCSGQQQIAIVDPGRNESVNQYGCRFVIE